MDKLSIMKLQFNFKGIFIKTVCILYVLLFTYAAVSKILDFERFQVQLAQSPLLSAFALWVSWIVIGIELVIVLLLMITKSRIAGLFAALGMMTMFTVYIFIILHYSSFIPCSCGGILEKMTWNVHLIFNMLFMMLAISALYFYTRKHRSEKDYLSQRFYVRMSAFSLTASTLIVVVLFILSEDIIHNKNPFIRRYPQNTIDLIRTVDLKYNSYYFAGFLNDEIYLGNYTDPLHLTAIDAMFKNRKISLSFNDRGLPFRSVKIVIRGSLFYLMDGSVPCIFRGDIKDGRVRAELEGMPAFTAAEPIDSTTVAFRAIDVKRKVNVLGVFDSKGKSKVKYSRNILKQQIDGIFDTDGMLLYNEEFKQIVYTYFYRNQFITADKNGRILLTGNTIDTIAHAKIKVAYLKDNSERQMGAPPLLVNAVTATRNNLLFVNSRVPGKFENDKVWKQSSIVDVYDMETKKYLLSFPVYGAEGQKIKTMFVTSEHLYVMIGAEMTIYRLGKELKKNMKSKQGSMPDA